MPIWLLANWRLVAEIAAVAVLGIMLGITRMELSSERAARASERAARAAERQAAAEFALQAEKSAREKDNKNAELASKLDADHAARVADIDATRDDFNRRLADGLRARRQTCSNSVPATTDAAGQPAAVATGGDGGRGPVDIASVTRLRVTVKKLQADVLECWAWGADVGR